MKKNFIFIALMSITMIFAGCNIRPEVQGPDEPYEAEKSEEVQLLEQAAEAAQSALPIEVSEGVSITAVEFKDNRFVYTETVAPEADEVLQNAINNSAEIKASLIESLKGKETGQAMFSLCKPAEVNIVYKYINPESKVSTEIVITPDDM